MKKLYFFLAAITFISNGASETESEITKAMIRYKIIPNIIDSFVPELLKMTYDNGIVLNMGNEITPYQARNPPNVDWDSADENSYYTLIGIDVDAPSPNDPYVSNLLTWMVGNIPGKDIDSGKVLAEYLPDAPPRGSEMHRSVYLLYKQPGKLEFCEEPIDKYTFKGRARFLLNDFCTKYGLFGPIAGNFYLDQYDPYVLEIYKQLNYGFQFNKPK